MRRILEVTSIALALTGTVAVAQSSADSWAGWYGGVSLGYYDGTITEDEVINAGPTFTGEYNGDGAVAGVFGGRNWQNDTLIYGFEARLHGGEEFAWESNSATSNYFMKNRGMLSVNGRVGQLVTPQTMIFGTAGLSVGNFRYDWNRSGNQRQFDETYAGFNLGVGVEHKISATGALRAEVTYYDTEVSGTVVTDLFTNRHYEDELSHTVISVGYTHFFDN